MSYYKTRHLNEQDSIQPDAPTDLPSASAPSPVFPDPGFIGKVPMVDYASIKRHQDMASNDTSQMMHMLDATEPKELTIEDLQPTIDKYDGGWQNPAAPAPEKAPPPLRDVAVLSAQQLHTAIVIMETMHKRLLRMEMTHDQQMAEVIRKQRTIGLAAEYGFRLLDESMTAVTAAPTFVKYGIHETYEIVCTSWDDAAERVALYVKGWKQCLAFHEGMKRVVL